MSTSVTRIKICGLRDIGTIEAMNGLPFHEIGFVFAPSKRQVSRQEASSLIAAAGRIKAAECLPPSTVGVFVDMPIIEMEELLSSVPLHIVQLHGSESPQYCKRLKESHPNTIIWRVFSVGKDGLPPSEQTEVASKQISAYEGAIDAILIDAPGGGTGQTFDWQAIEVYRTAAASSGLPLYVAGGLHVENVGELIATFGPDGVDVSSGVESDGRKDIEKIRAFVRKVTES
ncbi:phosphoribosylanthranilate isomerase [Paenibacillus sp. strain BS8-2]